MQIDVETVVVVALNYRNGTVSTGLIVQGAAAERTDSMVVATIDVERTGNAAFIGRVNAEIVDANGRVVGAAEEVLAVYHQIRRRLNVPVAPDAVAPLKVRFTIDTERDDLPPGAPLPFAGITHVVEVE
jgi:hypothetical protein